MEENTKHITINGRELLRYWLDAEALQYTTRVDNERLNLHIEVDDNLLELIQEDLEQRLKPDEDEFIKNLASLYPTPYNNTEYEVKLKTDYSGPEVAHVERLISKCGQIVVEDEKLHIGDTVQCPTCNRQYIIKWEGATVEEVRR